jgi:hypothetical protein
MGKVFHYFFTVFHSHGSFSFLSTEIFSLPPLAAGGRSFKKPPQALRLLLKRKLSNFYPGKIFSKIFPQVA